MSMEPQSRDVILVVGDNTIDEMDGVTRVGGNAVNVAVQLARHGYRVRYAGVIGRDANGRIIRSALRTEGLESDLLEVRDGDSAVTIVGHTPAGDRVFVSEQFGVTGEYFPGEAAIDAARSACWVHIGMLPDAPGFVTELRRQVPDVRISQDCAVSRGLTGLDLAFCSVGENDSARTAAESARRGGAREVVVTRGAAGAVAFDGLRWWDQEALPTTVVDTTGAGDSFIAGFVSRRAFAASTEEALHSGAEWAAVTCSHLGGWPQEGIAPSATME